MASSPSAGFDPKSPRLSRKVILHGVQRFPGPHCPTLRLSPSRAKYRSNTARKEVWQGLPVPILIQKVQDLRALTHANSLLVVADLLLVPRESNFLVSSAENASVTLDSNIPSVRNARGTPPLLFTKGNVTNICDDWVGKED